MLPGSIYDIDYGMHNMAEFAECCQGFIILITRLVYKNLRKMQGISGEKQ